MVEIADKTVEVVCVLAEVTNTLKCAVIQDVNTNRVMTQVLTCFVTVNNCRY
jgi:hypothetical protein